MATTTTASAVSAILRRGGFNPLGSGTPRSREGLRVSRSATDVHVVADLDAAGAAGRMADDAAEILREAGYEIDRSSTSASFYVTGRKDT
jgi:hypothetical protein